MKELSLKNRILKYLRSQSGWVNGGEIEKIAQSVGKKASNASRRCRELYNEDLLERKVEKSLNSRVASVWYRAKSPQSIIKYYVPATGQTIIKKIY